MTQNQELCLWVTPKIFDDINDPRPGVEAFLDHYVDWFIDRDITIVFCTGNGDHILNYRGTDHLDDTFDWARYNAYAWDPSSGETFYAAARRHNQNWLCRVREEGERSHNPYSAGPMTIMSDQRMDYRILAGIYQAFTFEAKRRNLHVRLLEYLEPGPEFCRSEWKTRRHPEATRARADSGGHYIPGLIDVTANLHTDTRSYAGWPHGVPPETPAGDFVAVQSGAYVKAFGIDGILLGNQFGLLGLWDPSAAPELTNQRREGIRRFFLAMRDALGESQLYWMDTYWRMSVEIDTWGMSPECYDVLDAIVVCTFAVLVERTEILANLRSKAPLAARTLYALDFVDPWYAYRVHLDDIRTYRYQREILANNGELIDGITFFANDTFGFFVPQKRLRETFTSSAAAIPAREGHRRPAIETL